MKNNIYDIVRTSITEVIGAEADEVILDASLEDDLGIDMLEAYPKIVKTINKKLDVELPMDDRGFISELKNCETVAELVDLIETETEF